MSFENISSGQNLKTWAVKIRCDLNTAQYFVYSHPEGSISKFETEIQLWQSELVTILQVTSN